MNLSLLFIIVNIFFNTINEENNFENKFFKYYNNATEATFYAASTYNSYHELELTKSYIDSASFYLNKLPSDFINKKKYSDQLKVLKKQYDSSLGIAIDNINYIFPSFSAFAGYRDDYIKVDDPQELLIESLIENIIIQSDPVIKGSIKNNNQFILVNLDPFDETLLGVSIDYINSNTNAFTILSHEIIKILGIDGYDRFKSNQLIYQDFEKLMLNYNVDKIYNFSIKLNKTSIKNLFYSGISFNIIKKNNYSQDFLRYYESFRINKESDFFKSISISAFFIFLIFFILFFGFNNFSQNKFKFNKENFQSDTVIILSVVFSLFISDFVLRLFVPEINAFKGELYTKLWLLGFLVLPIIIGIISSFLIHTKFSKSISTDLKNKQKIIYVSLLSPIIINLFYSIYSQIFFDYTFVFYSIFFSFCLIYPSKHISFIIHKYQNKGDISKLYLISVLLLFINYFISLFFLITENSYLIIALITFAPLLFFNYKFKNRKLNIESFNELNLEYTLYNPLEYIKSGINIDTINSKLLSFLKNDLDIVFIIEGETNIGKTRFVKEFINDSSSDFECFYGDFNEFKEGSIQLYEPFYEAFCLHPNPKYKLDKGFFTDRSKTFNAIKKVASIASASAPINLGELISIDDNQNLSVDEISGELIDILIEFSINKKIILFLDDFQWVDSATNELLLNFIKKIKYYGLRTKNIKIVLTVCSQEESLGSENEIFKTSLLQIIDATNSRVVKSRLKADNHYDFLNELFKDGGYQYFDKQNPVKFSQNLKIHLENVIKENNNKINPGYMFSYIMLLKQSNNIIIENNNLILIKEPGSNITYQDSLHLIMKSSFDNLDDNEKQILESAAYIGVKFDASILANIWKTDLIEMIKVLEKIEDLNIINDESEYDNIYSFSNKNFHKWLRSNYNEINRSDFSQKVIEVQKRIIKSLVIKGDDFIKKLDVDILKSISYRCDKYNHIDEIKVHGLKFHLITANKLAKQNKLKESAKHLTIIFDQLKTINHEEIEMILSTLNFLIGYKNGFKDLDVIIDKSENNYLDFLLNSLIVNGDKDQRSTSIILFLKDVYKRNLINNKKHKKLSSNLIDRINLLNQYKKFISEKDMLIGDFYYSLIENDRNYIPLLNFRKSAIKNKKFDLVFEIGMQLLEIFNNKTDLKNMYSICQESLYILSNKYVNIFNKKDIDYNSTKNIMIEILSDTNITLENAKKLSKLMSKYVEIYFIKKQYDHVIEISELNESLATRINDEVTLSSNLPIVAASYFFKNKIDIAEEYYYKHFKLLLKLKSKKEDFMHPLDGILNCCEVKNNYEKFNDLKKELYSNLLFISCDMMNNKFKESKINQKKSLQDHLNENSIKSNKSHSLFKDNNLQLSIDIFKITYLISKSDGEVHSSEIYDILQSVNAINFSMGEQTEVTLKDVKIQKEEIDKLDFNEYHDFVNILSKKITEKHDQSTVRSIYHFCLDIAKADGIIKNSEQMILNIIKDNFDIYEIH